MPTASSTVTAVLEAVDTNNAATPSLDKKSRTSYPTYDTGEFEPSWVSARRANFTKCAFYRLPEEVILQILVPLDNPGRAMAMRTCGLLLRISFDRTIYTIPWTFEDPPEGDIHVWPPFSPLAFTSDGRGILRLEQDEVDIKILLDRDRYCGACRRFREDGRYEKALDALMQQTLWCSHCSRMHRRVSFSAHQRATASTDETRICVLAEGRASFCTHRSLGFDDSSLANIVPPASAWTDMEDFCRHPDHDPDSWYTRWIGALKDWPSLKRPRVHQFRDGSKMGGSFGNLMSDTRVFLFHLDHSIPITRGLLQEKLVAKAFILDKHLCPHVTANDGQLLLPFGPDRCACFDDPRWILHNCEAYKSFSCCRCHVAKTPGSRVYFMEGEGRYLTQRHEYSCVTCGAEYAWLRDGSAVYLEINMDMGDHDPELFTLGPPSPRWRPNHWLYSIHPESWVIQNDEELRHVGWCENVNCMSRWRWESLTRLLEDAF
ncbi:hypothetical protein V8F06_004900 [Rhypophila decipiens]